MSVVEHVVAGNDRQTEKFSCCFDQLGDVVMLSRCHVNAIHLQNAEHPSEQLRLSYCRETARRDVPVEILSTAA